MVGTENDPNKRAKSCEIGVGGNEIDDFRDYILRLPFHIIVDIFLKLPVKTLVQCRCVCKVWRALFSDPHFTKLHFSRAPTCFLLHSNRSFKRNSQNLLLVELGLPSGDAILRISNTPDFPNFGIELVGSCNGLMCMYDRQKNGPIYVSNPVIGEYLSVPSAVDDQTLPLVCGLGFSQKDNQYKLIQIVPKLSFDDDKMEAKMWTLGSDTWRSIGDVPFLFSPPSFGTFLHGNLHWIADYSRGSELICCLDLETEQFRALPPPPAYRPSENRLFWENPGVLEDCLYFTCCLDNYADTVDIWVMEEYGIKTSWTRKFVVRDPGQSWWDPIGFRVLRVLKSSGGLLVLCNFRLYFYDPKKCVFKRVEIDGIQSQVEAMCYFPSFTSLKDVIRGKSQRYEE
ncbi:F-box protein [Forsythia ovata]|uniref:F-box protein n=1 Tax=Forsythia ovata TaxID=205694 RepID=A0ABD1WLG2_9LAMI